MTKTISILICLTSAALAAQGPSVAEYPSIQEAIRANPGQMVYVPTGDYEIAEKIHIGPQGGGLFGPGCIRQTNPKQPILVIEGAFVAPSITRIGCLGLVCRMQPGPNSPPPCGPMWIFSAIS